MSLDNLETDYERAEYLQKTVIGRVTNETSDDAEYQRLRQYFLDNPETKPLLPSLVRVNRDLAQIWQDIGNKFQRYAERRTHIWSEFRPLLDFLEAGAKVPSDQRISDGLSRLNLESIQIAWDKALDRRQTDPEGAITAARTLLETICKHILDKEDIDYKDKADLPELYHQASSVLNLAPSQHTETVFKQILGGCTTVVNGLGTLRNRLGDAHGQGQNTMSPASRHATLAVNLAGSVALFLAETWESQMNRGNLPDTVS